MMYNIIISYYNFQNIYISQFSVHLIFCVLLRGKWCVNIFLSTLLSNYQLYYEIQLKLKMYI